jgi:hypothetical protein
MSEVLQVAKALSRSTDLELERIIGIRLMPSAAFKDFFDFAQALVKPQNIKGAVAGLTKNQITAFQNLINNKSTKADLPSLEVLAKLLLVEKRTEGTKTTFVPLESAQSIFLELAFIEFGKKLETLKLSTSFPTNQELIDPQAGIGAYETVQALTELIIELEQRLVPEVGRGGVGLPELKRLANFLGKDVDYARRLYSLAQIAGLIVLYQKRWRVGSNYQFWLRSSPSERWLHLAKAWLVLLGPESASELADETDLAEAINDTFPLASEGIASHMTDLIKLAELIGLTAGNQTSSWFKLLMTGDSTGAQKLIDKQLPKTQNKVIVQADLTVISTGPLDTETELMLRRFVDIERIGVASSYRISPLSLTYGMETGLTETQIRATLKSLSGTELPQPVDYLLRETAARFGRLVIRAFNEGTVVEIKDRVLLAQIENDSELRALALKQTSETELFTRFDPEMVYYQLRESRYPAIAQDASGKIIASWFNQSSEVIPNQHSVAEDIARWREHDKRMGEAPLGDDIVRQLELAIKSKALVKVTVVSDKVKREFNLAPTGLANGRLRAKDKQADCERVIPVSLITAVVIG